MDFGDVDNRIRPLDLGMLPPWEIIVNLADGGKQNIKIPYSEGAHVVGLPLGSDVPNEIASNYKTLLCMVNGMTSVITNLTLKLEQQQKVASCYLDNLNRFRFENEELTCTVGDGVAVPQASVSPSKKRKLSTEVTGPFDTQAVCLEKPEHLPPPTSNDNPAMIEENIDESDDLTLTRVKRLRGEHVSTIASLICSDAYTENVESNGAVVPVGNPFDAKMASTSTNCQTVDFTALPISICINDLTLSSMKHSGSEDSDSGALVVCEHVDATMTSTSANCQTVNCTALTNSTPADNTLPLILSTSVSSREGDEWVNVDNFRIPKVYADLYTKIYRKHGHMSTKKVIRSNNDILLVCVTSLLKIVTAMETVRGVDLSVALLESWEGDIGDAETLQFNIKWLREIFNKLKKSWKLSFTIDKEVESSEQVLEATQVEYAGLRSRKDELEAELVEVKVKIREFEGKLSSEREAIQVKMAEKNIFLFEPVLGNLFNLELTN